MNHNTWKLQCFRCSSFDWLVLAMNFGRGLVTVWHVDESGNVVEYAKETQFPDLRQFYSCPVKNVHPLGRSRIRAVVESRTGQAH